MDELSSVLDSLGGEELSGRFGSQLLPRLRGLLAARNRLDAEIARTVRECELTQASEIDGLKTMASWLRGHGRLSPGAAAGVVRAGRALAELPAVAAACATGAVSAEQVAVIAPVTRPEHLAAAEAQGVDLAGVDQALTQVAATRPHSELRQVVSHYLARLDPDGAEPDPTEGRSLVWARHPDGAVSGRLELDAVGGEKLLTALEAVVQAGRCADDERSRAQQNADALVQLADLMLAAGGLPVLRTVKPHVGVTVDISDLVNPTAGTVPGTGPGAGLGTARTGLGAVIPAARARLLACDGAVTRIVFGPAGQPLDLGRTHRVVPPHLRKAIEARDLGCVFAGCDAPTHWCEVHHLLHWADDGETDLPNLALLCERHHTKVHHGFTVHRDTDGRWHTHRPDGTEIRTGFPTESRADSSTGIRALTVDPGTTAGLTTHRSRQVPISSRRPPRRLARAAGQPVR